MGIYERGRMVYFRVVINLIGREDKLYLLKMVI
jgi:hypothetical protein